MSPLLLIAVPEAETVADPLASVQSLADELSRLQPVDWEQDLDRGGGPCLALGAERRLGPR